MSKSSSPLPQALRLVLSPMLSPVQLLIKTTVFQRKTTTLNAIENFVTINIFERLKAARNDFFSKFWKLNALVCISRQNSYIRTAILFTDELEISQHM